jgi:hypothetical protein
MFQTTNRRPTPCWCDILLKGSLFQLSDSPLVSWRFQTMYRKRIPCFKLPTEHPPRAGVKSSCKVQCFKYRTARSSVGGFRVRTVRRFLVSNCQPKAHAVLVCSLLQGSLFQISNSLLVSWRFQTMYRKRIPCFKLPTEGRPRAGMVPSCKVQCFKYRTARSSVGGFRVRTVK